MGAERVRALRERRRRGLRELSVEVHEDELREIVLDFILRGPELC
jgi:hypothetical protein